MVKLEIENDSTSISNLQGQNGNVRNSKASNNGPILQRYNLIYIIYQMLGVFLISSVFFWLTYYRNGFSFSETTKVCNWHPLLMTISFIYLFANSILHFRNFRNTRKQKLKTQHAIINCCIIILALLGIWAGFNSNMIADPTIPKFYSLHSWLGILCVFMFLFQFAGGFLSFLYPEVALKYKEALMPYHIFFGVLTFVLSIVTSVLGFSEKIIFALKQQHEYIPIEGLLLNFVGITLFFYGVLVVYMLIKPEYKRSPKPKDRNGNL